MRRSCPGPALPADPGASAAVPPVLPDASALPPAASDAGAPMPPVLPGAADQPAAPVLPTATVVPPAMIQPAGAAGVPGANPFGAPGAVVLAPPPQPANPFVQASPAPAAAAAAAPPFALDVTTIPGAATAAPRRHRCDAGRHGPAGQPGRRDGAALLCGAARPDARRRRDQAAARALSRLEPAGRPVRAGQHDQRAAALGSLRRRRLCGGARAHRRAAPAKSELGSLGRSDEQARRRRSARRDAARRLGE